MANDMDNSDTELGLLKGESVSLLNSSSNKALEMQSRIILNFITGLTEQLAKNNTADSTVHVTECGPAFEFKQKGTKFNLVSIKKGFQSFWNWGTVKKGDCSKAALVITEEKASLQQKNKILKIAYLHGLDTVHEYLDR